jgi:hypothetical protein
MSRRSGRLGGAGRDVLSYGIPYSQMKSDEKTWWQKQEPSQWERSPGPGDYNGVSLETTLPGGGRFNLSNPKSDVEWKMHTASKLPGPGQYDTPNLGTGISGGRFNMSKPKGIIDQAIYKSASLPGPNSYSAREDLKKKQGGRVYSKPAKKVGSVDTKSLHQMWNSLHPSSSVLVETKKTFNSGPQRRPVQRRAPPQPDYVRTLTAVAGARHDRQLTKSGLLIIRPRLMGPKVNRR